jgi:hypothetical protein
MNPLRRILLILMLAVTMIVTNSYAQPAHDECGCCTGAQQMMCAACKVCTTPGLVATPAVLSVASRPEIVATIPRLNPSRHTEDIWHPPRHIS